MLELPGSEATESISAPQRHLRNLFFKPKEAYEEIYPQILMMAADGQEPGLRRLQEGSSGR